MTPADNRYTIEECDAVGNGRTKFSVSNFTRYTNLKMGILGAGEPGGIYAGRCKRFTDKTMRECLGLMTLDGIAPTQQMRRKVRPQKASKTVGNDEIARIMGPSAGHTWQLFKTFLGCQDPLSEPPPKKECPNYKCHELMDWARFMWRQGWILNPDFSIDEQVSMVTGKSEYKSRTGLFKRIGDGLPADTLADDGYTWYFYFRNEPVEEKWLDMGLSPLHCRLMHMFSLLKDTGHTCTMDNLFNSVKFTCAAYNLEVKGRRMCVKVQGVIRASGRGVPKCVKQEAMKTKAA